MFLSNYPSNTENQNAQGINPIFDLKKYNIGVNEIRSELREKEQSLENCETTDNPFPVEVFPEPFSSIIKQCNEALNFPLDYIGLAIIVSISTVIGRSAQLKVKNRWYEFASLFTAIIGKAGANKSHPIDFAFRPLGEMDIQSIERYTGEFNEYQELLSMNKKEKDASLKLKKPKLPKTILNNFTPEALAERLSENDRACVVVSDELATFLETMNQYSKGDQTSTYLTIWSNKPTSIDRVSKPIPISLIMPFLNICGSLQPRVLAKLFHSGKSDNGFLQRFLFAYPDNVEKQPINDNEIDEATVRQYEGWIRDYYEKCPIIYDSETGIQKPKLYYWSDEAKVYFYDWQKKNTERVNENSDNLLGEILSKYDIHFIRLSLIMQVMLDYSTNEISLQAVEGAAKLCSYFINCSIKVLDELEAGGKSAMLPENKKQLFHELPDVFTTSEGVSMAKQYSIPERSFKRFLGEKDFFKRISSGKYEKQK